VHFRSLSRLAVVVAIVTFAARGGAQTVDEQAEFKKGRYAYEAKSYDDADALFRRMLDPQTGTLHDKGLVNEARMYWGATLIARGHRDEASAQFDAILTVDPNYQPDPTKFPLEVGKVFIDAQALNTKKAQALAMENARREKLRKEQEEAAKQAQVQRLKDLEILVGQEYVTAYHSRWVALLPGGAGQFQNGRSGLGYFFLTTESLLLAGGIATVPIYLVQLSDASGPSSMTQKQPIAQAYLDRANEARIANLIFYGALAFTTVAGIIEAEVSYVPDVTGVKPRKLPDLPGVSPDAKPPGTSELSWTFGAAPVYGADGKGGVTGGVLSVGGRF
jgi:tetratricopeptide (TPR) repeat protein